MALTALPSAHGKGVPRFGTVDLWRPIDFLYRRGSEPVDASSISIFRIAFGIVALVAILRMFAHGWIDQLYVEPLHHFSYVGFEWVRAWPAPWMHLHFAALGAAVNRDHSWLARQERPCWSSPSGSPTSS